MNPRTLPACVLFLAASLGSSSHAATLLTWADSVNNGTTPGVPSPATNVTGGALTRGSGITSDTFGAEVIIGAKGANAASLDDNDYFQFTLAPQSGYSLDLDSLSVNTRGGTPSWTVRSSLDSFTANLIAPSSSNSLTTVTLGSAFDSLESAVTFRIYVWNASSANSSVGLENDSGTMSVQGTITAVPEPSSVALLAFTALGAVVLGKRLRRSSRSISQ